MLLATEPAVLELAGPLQWARPRRSSGPIDTVPKEAQDQTKRKREKPSNSQKILTGKPGVIDLMMAAEEEMRLTQSNAERVWGLRLKGIGISQQKESHILGVICETVAFDPKVTFKDSVHTPSMISYDDTYYGEEEVTPERPPSEMEGHVDAVPTGLTFSSQLQKQGRSDTFRKFYFPSTIEHMLFPYRKTGPRTEDVLPRSNAEPYGREERKVSCGRVVCGCGENASLPTFSVIVCHGLTPIHGRYNAQRGTFSVSGGVILRSAEGGNRELSPVTG
ncbi:hypothetical protein CB1_000877019 [Camelus ferus]|nr:hypothetical protein CB1_000877019 [Camelus ferus]